MSDLGPGVQFKYLPGLFAYGLLNMITIVVKIYLLIQLISQVLPFNVKLWLFSCTIQYPTKLGAYGLIFVKVLQIQNQTFLT